MLNLVADKQNWIHNLLGFFQAACHIADDGEVKCLSDLPAEGRGPFVRYDLNYTGAVLLEELQARDDN